MTDREQEHKENTRWRLRDRYRDVRIFRQMVDNEFLSPEDQRRWRDRSVRQAVTYAYGAVPYYRTLLDELGLTPGDIRSASELTELPLLGKRELYDHTSRLTATELPPGERIAGTFSSSGTTGRPAKIVHTGRSNAMFSYLSHRQWRFLRADPGKRLATIRLSSQLPRTDGKVLPDGIAWGQSSWRYVGEFFHTGPSAYCNVTNPVEQQIEFLQKFQPAYLLSYPETLEQLAFAADDSFPRETIDGLIAISEQMTPEMERRITRVFEAEVRQPYGLNEIGLVAAMCDAGRYHVHSEHCVVELIDERGQPCREGERGRIIVTSLNNAAMPLLRYDTDDLAEAVSADCPCGRTLPSFGRVYGRYSRIAYLPEGTLWRVGIIREAIEANPDELARNLRQYQIYQSGDDAFEVRLACTAPLPEKFLQNIQRKWMDAGNGGLGLTFTQVASIPRGPGGKHQEFDSAFYPGGESA
jgi:phenylacetate-CoA ligase